MAQNLQKGARIEAPKALGEVWGGVSPPQPTWESGGASYKLPQRGPGRSPGCQRVLPYFRVKKTSFWTEKCILEVCAYVLEELYLGLSIT